ncbi:MAG: glycosyltransferase family 9 protein [Acidobacteria bacterium]|nr:glycosyltransferase family 9 protein [Acidobacteriota bacterium]
MTILLIRLRLIGDVVFTTPAIRALRARYPEARLLYLVESAAAPVVAANPHLSEVIVVPHTHGWARVRDDVRLARRLRAERCDLVVDFHGGPRSAWLTLASGAQRRIGYDIRGRTWMYTTVVHRPRGLHPRHSVENQWDLLAAVDPDLAGMANPTTFRVEMPVTPDAAARVTAWLALHGIAATGPSPRLIVMHVSAGNPFRRWPASAFADVAAGLVRQSPDRRVLVTAGPSDRDAVQRILSDARTRAGDAAAAIINAEEFSLADLRAMLDRSALYIGGDSGPMHIAATSDVPIVGLYGPTLAARSAPWRPASLTTESVDAGDLPCRPCDQRVCAPGDFRCLTSIEAGTVLRAAERILGEAS